MHLLLITLNAKVIKKLQLNLWKLRTYGPSAIPTHNSIPCSGEFKTIACSSAAGLDSRDQLSC